MDEKAREFHIYCDGVELPLAPFVATLFSETIAAMAGTLKGTEKCSTVTITLTMQDKNSQGTL